MTGCSDCEEADVALKDKDITEMFEVQRVYRTNETRDGKVIDEFSMLRHIFSIDWYPTFVILLDDGIEFVRKTPTDDLKAAILGS
jgi:hypothetical protein